MKEGTPNSGLVWRTIILVGLTFTTLTPNIIRWDLIPIRHGAALGQMGFAFMAGIYWLCYDRDRSLIKQLWSNRYIVTLIGFGLIVALFIPLSVSPAYGLDKTLRLAIKAIVPVIAYSLLGPYTSRDFSVIFCTVITGGLLMGVQVFTTGNAVGSRISVGVFGPIYAARIAGTGATAALVALLLRRRLDLTVFLLILCLAITLPAIMLTGTRGPLLAVGFAAIAGPLLFRWKSLLKPKRLVRALVVLVMAAGGFFVVVHTMGDLPAVQRIITNVGSLGDNTSDLARIDRFKVALGAFRDSRLLGIGTGGFGVLYGWGVQDYPHNVMLEVASEQGLLGLVALLILLFLVLKRMVAIANSGKIEFHHVAVFSLWFYTFFNASVSGDIGANYTFWVTGVFPWLFSHHGVESDRTSRHLPTRSRTTGLVSLPIGRRK